METLRTHLDLRQNAPSGRVPGTLSSSKYRKMSPMRRCLATSVASVNPQCRYERAIFIIGHMRCGSTALSNVLCSRDDISGYGESHIRHWQPGALGWLVLKQWRRGHWKPRARHLFDKILHSYFDVESGPQFFRARAIFMVRSPAETIPSIRRLYQAIGSDKYGSDDQAARYYTERLWTMLELWQRFAPARRAGISHEALTADPDGELARIGGRLGLNPPLTNSYRRPQVAMEAGVGDPLSSHKFDRIVAASTATTASEQQNLDLAPERLGELNALYSRCVALFGQAMTLLLTFVCDVTAFVPASLCDMIVFA
ncbi:MAG: sulfotransferase [Betaproteobacteria bacterium]|nr:sulfotransferase [Betaproteobacteria bacterium]